MYKSLKLEREPVFHFRKSIALFRQKAKQPLAVLRHWQENYYSRQALRKLDSHQLSDIGLSSEQVRKECQKPFWIN